MYIYMRPYVNICGEHIYIYETICKYLWRTCIYIWDHIYISVENMYIYMRPYVNVSMNICVAYVMLQSVEICMYVHICIYVIYMRICICTCINIRTCIYLRIHIYVDVRIYTYEYTYVHICSCMSIRVSMTQ